MAQTNIILNGDFNAGSLNWTGTDIEANHTEGAYLGNGSSNRVAELDGNSGQTTVMEQEVSIANAMSTTLTFNMALRNASAGQAGSEGFRVDILDDLGNVIATEDYFPLNNTWGAQSLDVTFPSAGDYRIRFTELGPDNSLGAIVDNISMMVCFVAGSRITTEKGAIPVEKLQVGDLVWTLDRGMQPIRWISKRKVSLAEQLAEANLRPVTVKAGAFGGRAPMRDLHVSRQHRIFLSGAGVATHCADGEVLVNAGALVNRRSVVSKMPKSDITYVHFMFDRHEIVEADGLLSESFYPGPAALRSVDLEARQELFRLFPELRNRAGGYGDIARPVLKAWEAQALASLMGARASA